MSYGGAGPGRRLSGPGAHDSALLAHAGVLLERQLDACVRGFYRELEHLPEAKVVLDRLTDHERRRLDRTQAGYLRELLAPDADPDELAERSRDIGRIHAMVGVDMDWYVSASLALQQVLFERLDRVTPLTDQVAMHAAVSTRFTADLHSVLRGYRDIDAAQAVVMMRVNEVVSEARTVADLARGVLDAVSCLDGMVAGFLGRPDMDGAFQFEVGAGDPVDAFMVDVLQQDAPAITIRDGQAAGSGPTGQAWRTGTIVRSDSYLTDPATAPWRRWGERFGWRSSVAVPLSGPHGESRALFAFYARWPGYFAHPPRQAMFVQLKQVVERALAALESVAGPGAGVSGFADRGSHIAMLDRGQVEMLYQPVVDLASGRVAKLEALARLVGPDRLVSPAEFLPAFGDEELVRLFEVGVDQSLRSLLEWQQRGLTTAVSVNLPVMSAYDDRYARAVAWALERYDVAPDRLTLELLESDFLDGDLRQAQAALGELKRIGVRLAQDDLGSGYSSLLRLRHFDFDDVKVDQGLVRGTEFAPRSALHFIPPISEIAHGLGLWVVVEGLETDGLIEAAVQLGVDAGQGYGIARPMPAAEVPGWAEAFRLDVDRDRPRTPLGALAAHVAWEHRLNAVSGGPARPRLVDPGACALSGYLQRQPDAVRLEREHLAVHHAALGARGSAEHRAAWEALARRVEGG